MDQGLKRARIKFYGSIILFLVLLGAGYFSYQWYINREIPPNLNPKPELLIRAEEKNIKLLNSDSFYTEVEKELSNDYAPGSFHVINFIQDLEGYDNYLSAIEFYTAARFKIPKLLASSTGDVNFGVLGPSLENISNHPFLIIEVHHYEKASEGMREWEEKMPQELGSFFSFTNHDGNFRDAVIRNLDARKFESGQAKIFYTFLNKQVIIITSSDRVLEDIIKRYEIFPPGS
jgi:hypothetical protein